MILHEATIKYKGYDPNILSKWSKDKICVSCDQCGRVRYDETKKKMRDSHPHLRGENSPNWKGGVHGIRDHVLSESQCIKLNKRFKGSCAHHLTSSGIIYIPRSIHKIHHNMKNGLNMLKINKISLDYLMGDFNDMY